MKTKRCSKCGVKKPATVKYFCKRDTNKDGLSGGCRQCRKAYKKEYDLGHPDSRKESNLRLKFDISLSDYYAMLDKQGGVCAVCGRPETSTYKGTLRSLAVDHDHVTGRVRGLLCAKCNKALGLLEENPVVIDLLREYITGYAD